MPAVVPVPVYAIVTGTPSDALATNRLMRAAAPAACCPWSVSPDPVPPVTVPRPRVRLVVAVGSSTLRVTPAASVSGAVRFSAVVDEVLNV